MNLVVTKGSLFLWVYAIIFIQLTVLIIYSRNFSQFLFTSIKYTNKNLHWQEVNNSNKLDDIVEFEFETSTKIEDHYTVKNLSSVPICPSPSPLSQGTIDVKQILAQYNWSETISFYKSKYRSPRARKYYREDGKELNTLDSLNSSSINYGPEGARMTLGGGWQPADCRSSFKTAIIIPFRDRIIHLRLLLIFLHLVMQRQLRDYRIFVVEPNTPSDLPFNKGRVMNAGFLEALKIDNSFDCFIFHDVDLLIEDDRNP
jgi:hypothetical protein